MGDSNKTFPAGAAAAARAMASIVLITFVAEFVIMWAMSQFGAGYGSLGLMLLDAALLALVIAPPIYLLVLVPLRQEYDRRLAAETRAEDLTQLAITDTLTRVLNRRGITLSLLDTMAQAERYGAPLTVCMADIDHFKEVNDRYGHKIGDQVLVEITGVLNEGLRMPDKLGRYGGEEYLVVLPHTTVAAGKKIAERLRAAVAKARIEADGKKLPMTISIGLTQYRKGEDLEQLLSRADKALYEAKNKGRNRVIATKIQRAAT
jgi:diguanylate cyclase (GGDEF)-like protein